VNPSLSTKTTGYLHRTRPPRPYSPASLRHRRTASAGRLEGMAVAHAAIYGGMLANFGARFATKVVDEGGRLHFFASSSPLYGSPPPVEEFGEIGGAFHGLKIPQSPSPLLDLAALFKMALDLRQHHVRILHTRSAKMSVIGALAGRLAGVPIIVHHQDDLYCRDSRLGPAAKWLVAKLEWALSMLVDKSLFVSDAVLRDALRIGFKPDRCVNVGHDLNPVLLRAALGGQTEDGPRQRHALLRNLGIPESALVVGSMGRLVSEKGFDTLLRAAKLVCATIPDCCFVIRGDGPLRPALETMIAESGLTGRAFLCTESLPEEEVPDLYRSFDVFALATRREGFGMVFAEAMAFGVPVVGPNTLPVSEVVGPGCGILVDPESAAQYSDALRELLSDPVFRRETGRNGRQYALKIWGGDTAAEKVIQIYCELTRTTGRQWGIRGRSV
jgi:glycosyltransferase involved in cell wall biosynthesis